MLTVTRVEEVTRMWGAFTENGWVRKWTRPGLSLLRSRGQLLLWLSSTVKNNHAEPTNSLLEREQVV